MACPAPFLSPNDFPSTGGYVPGRFCSSVTPELTCCLPCPTDKYLYSDGFVRSLEVGYWWNIPSFICQIFLLVTWLVLPPEVSHRHYLSIGICIFLAMMHLSFIIPLGTKPDICWNEITPSDMNSDNSCAVSGGMLSLGAMGIGVWLLLRSLWIHLRVCWDVKETKVLRYAAHGVGIALPILFLGLSLGITGISYRLSTTCVPNDRYSFLTWFGWLTAFGCLATLIQIVTIFFCLWVYLRAFFRPGGESTLQSTAGSTIGKSAMEIDAPPRKKVAWKRVKSVLKSQWRSILLCIVVAVSTIFYGTVFIATGKVAGTTNKNSKELQEWALCLVLNGGDKTTCGSVAPIIGINEDAVRAVWPIAGLTGTLTFILMIRRDMLTGWWHIIRYRKRQGSVGEEGFLVAPFMTRSVATPLDSESKHEKEMENTQPPMYTPHPDVGRPFTPVSPLLPPSATQQQTGGINWEQSSKPRAGSPYRAGELSPARLQERKLAPE
ncbi:hypothetical protein TI39_contig4179g00002 [Zymoseptoria brevis]|uniref:G-protein coupled receptors family 2 profile 2 domain-containing protein n=1 Tax=Zymoseptoria brevis TaxID=1047168 RepID=A0A0F4GAY1_9PEZI|nr:hypothetical protein TI39_contig4179g00002 [Zymoseptoria brevis]